MKMLFVSDLFEAMGRMSNANEAKQIFVATSFLLLLRTVTSLDVGKEVYKPLQIKDCNKVSTKYPKYPLQVEELTWPELVGEWASLACETRPGPNFVLR